MKRVSSIFDQRREQNPAVERLPGLETRRDREKEGNPVQRSISAHGGLMLLLDSCRCWAATLHALELMRHHIAERINIQALRRDAFATFD